MKKLPTPKCIIALLTLLFFTSLATAGGGGATPSLDTKEGLERAADNFLISFALLSKNEDVKLTPINEVEGSKGFAFKATLIEYEFNRSLWEFYISNPAFNDIPRSKDISQEEYRKFRNDYTLQRDLQRERDKNSANNSSIANIANTSKPPN